jgi:hypothetical protein
VAVVAGFATWSAEAVNVPINKARPKAPAQAAGLRLRDRCFIVFCVLVF